MLGALLLERDWPCGDCGLLVPLDGERNFLVLKAIGFGIFFLRKNFPFDSVALGAVHFNTLLMSWTLQGAGMRAWEYTTVM